jgi:hypothetical protein
MATRLSIFLEWAAVKRENRFMCWRMVWLCFSTQDVETSALFGCAYGDLHHQDGVADDVSFPLLALGSFSHLAVSLGSPGSNPCYWQSIALAA